MPAESGGDSLDYVDAYQEGNCNAMHAHNLDSKSMSNGAQWKLRIALLDADNVNPGTSCLSQRAVAAKQAVAGSSRC